MDQCCSTNTAWKVILAQTPGGAPKLSLRQFLTLPKTPGVVNGTTVKNGGRAVSGARPGLQDRSHGWKDSSWDNKDWSQLPTGVPVPKATMKLIPRIDYASKNHTLEKTATTLPSTSKPEVVLKPASKASGKTEEGNPWGDMTEDTQPVVTKATLLARSRLDAIRADMVPPPGLSDTARNGKSPPLAAPAQVHGNVAKMAQDMPPR